MRVLLPYMQILEAPGIRHIVTASTHCVCTIRLKAPQTKANSQNPRVLGLGVAPFYARRHSSDAIDVTGTVPDTNARPGTPPPPTFSTPVGLVATPHRNSDDPLPHHMVYNADLHRFRLIRGDRSASVPPGKPVPQRAHPLGTGLGRHPDR
ncbi:hypothetical protein NUW54_g3666 [Trametes sanguinea]|uniref:Uncharacterized protein n=1 Tax=Trametes sanguinea TaxID=158606 RepID=A0ACC1Q382_9APHY|nr:hypothetical protein NUW54_g3666 [Trametes sanguinea]